MQNLTPNLQRTIEELTAQKQRLESELAITINRLSMISGQTHFDELHIKEGLLQNRKHEIEFELRRISGLLSGMQMMAAVVA